MGYGDYSSSNRSLRTENKAAAKLKVAAEDLENTKSFLAANDMTWVESSNGLTVVMASVGDVGKLKSGLASHGISSNAFAMDSRMSGYAHRSGEEIFTQSQINNAMNPFGIQVRESRDSEEHPESLAIILGLDETGSMGTVPHFLVKEGLPTMIDRIIKGGVLHPQVLFMGIGDHECDNAPLQVGQFESNDELLDKWLTDLYLEGRGGGNDGESYLLAWYFAARHTATDCWDKRKKKGYLITIGDEPTLKRVPASFLKKLMGDGEYQDYTDLDLISKASEKWHIFHINVRETNSGGRREVANGWKQLLADNFRVAERRTDVADIVADIVLGGEHKTSTVIQPGRKPVITIPKEEMML